MDENGVEISNLVPYDANTENWIKNAPAIQGITDAFLGTFKMEPGKNLFNGASGMKMVSSTQELHITGNATIKM
jgi:hypothetical protein